eukprot:TRINITY_DN15143_c0_g1_i1.p1 TRINITY_DN15143_c0_g1~~TRINITY_DN15143_c0_g1_i1.p1  ORF type:complete len:429 (+),score=74.84 TRINITY_DN15143_c0_g1_i1:125-1288(+)
MRLRVSELLAPGHDHTSIAWGSSAPRNTGAGGTLRRAALSDEHDISAWLPPSSGRRCGGAGAAARSARAACFLEGPSSFDLSEGSRSVRPKRSAGARGLRVSATESAAWFPSAQARRTDVLLASHDASDAFLASRHASASSFLSLPAMPFRKGTGFVDLVQAMPASVLVPLHAATIVSCLPGHIAFELGEGYLYGFQKGFMLAFAGKALGAISGFAGARAAMRTWDLKDRVEGWLKAWPAAGSAAENVEKGGAFSVILLRIAPVPGAVKTYAPALFTDIPLCTFIPATLVGLLPMTAAHVYAGTLAASAADLTTHNSAALRVVASASLFAGASFVSLLAGYYFHMRSDTLALEEEAEASKDNLHEDDSALEPEPEESVSKNWQTRPT